MTTSEQWIIDGIILDTLEPIRDSFTLAIAQYKIPFQRGSKLKNMGLDDRSIAIKCIFMEERYTEHKSFVDRMAATMDHELNHPVWGLLKGSIISCVIGYDDKESTAEIDLTYLVAAEDKPESLIFLPTTISWAIEERYAEAQTRQMDRLIEDLTDSVGSEAAEIVSAEVDPDLTLLEQFTSVSLAARNYIAEIDAAIARCEATLAGIEISSSSYINTIDFGTGLPGRLVAAMARVCERLCQGGITLADSPKSWLTNLDAAYSGFRALFANDLFPAADQMLHSQTVRYSLETAYQYKIDNDNALALRQIETEHPFDIMGRRVNTETAPGIMTINDLDETLYTARSLLQQCIDINRSSAWTFKRIAEALFIQVQETRLQRMRIIAVSVETVMPLHLICVKNGLPISMADRILSINPRIKNPNAVSGEVSLYAA